MLTRRGLLRGLLGAAAVAAVPGEIARSYFFIGRPGEIRSQYPFDTVDAKTIRLWQRSLADAVLRPSVLFDARLGLYRVGFTTGQQGLLVPCVRSR